ncbi:hypothetical protein GQ43DRAFT_440925 [Delitschia confertaspora ATCC 74209]|uniref:MARVEL domain-containing protein n=1 Tax=Delitschia confertaspora ATCC 74209 TaxID=1513339 RepID=A0A9P4JR67_9PLEO|nr:hypothetical protein GQ43DRAFT_440925 [Delitschia confertaspora ATCC 74209]
MTRMTSLFLRFSQLVSAAVVLGLMAHFLRQRYRYGVNGGPEGREVYSLALAALSIPFALYWMLHAARHTLHYPFDLIMSGAWFAAFGVLVRYLARQGCGTAFDWSGVNGVGKGSHCGQWRAAEAFSFISAILWLASAILNALTYHRKTADTAPHPHDETIETAPAGRPRRRWGRASGV